LSITPDLRDAAGVSIGPLGRPWRGGGINAPIVREEVLGPESGLDIQQGKIGV
jgi:hypothetical protein